MNDLPMLAPVEEGSDTRPKITMLWWLNLGLAVIGLIFGGVGLWIYEKNVSHIVGASYPPADIFSIIYHTLQLLILHAPHLDQQVPWQLHMGRLLIAFWFLSTAYGVSLKIFPDEIRLLRLQLRYWFYWTPWVSKNKHVVICGLGDLGLRLAIDGSRKGKFIVAIEKHPSAGVLEQAHESGVLVLDGDALDPVILRKTRIEHAGWLLPMARDDRTNVAIAMLAGRMVANIKHGVSLRCNLLLQDSRLGDQLTDHFFRYIPLSKYHVTFSSLDLNKTSARQALRRHPLDFQPIIEDSTTVVHLVIIGFGQTGQCLAHYAAQIGHFANEIGEHPRKIKITVVDKDAVDKVENFKKRYLIDGSGNFDKTSAISPWPYNGTYDYDNVSFTESILSYCQPERQKQLISYVICIEDIPDCKDEDERREKTDLINLRTGMKLFTLLLDKDEPLPESSKPLAEKLEDMLYMEIRKTLSSKDLGPMAEKLSDKARKTNPENLLLAYLPGDEELSRENYAVSCSWLKKQLVDILLKQDQAERDLKGYVDGFFKKLSGELSITLYQNSKGNPEILWQSLTIVSEKKHLIERLWSYVADDKSWKELTGFLTRNAPKELLFEELFNRLLKTVIDDMAVKLSEEFWRMLPVTRTLEEIITLINEKVNAFAEKRYYQVLIHQSTRRGFSTLFSPGTVDDLCDSVPRKPGHAEEAAVKEFHTLLMQHPLQINAEKEIMPGSLEDYRKILIKVLRGGLHGILGSHVHTFGMKEDVYTWDNLVHESEDQMARAVHEQYRKLAGGPEWEYIGEGFKESSRLAADHIPIKLRALGYCDCPIHKSKKCNKKLVNKLILRNDKIKLLARMEHARWCAERFLAGWKWGLATDRDRKINKCLVEWDKLDDKEKPKDFEQIRAIPEILKKANRGIYSSF